MLLVENPDIRTIFTKLRLDANKLADSKCRSYRFKNQTDNNCSECHIADGVLHRLFHCRKRGLNEVRVKFYKDISSVCRDLQFLSDREKCV